MKKCLMILAGICALALLAPAHGDGFAPAAVPEGVDVAAGEEVVGCGSATPALPEAPLVEAASYSGDYACVSAQLCSYRGTPCSGYTQCAVPRVQGCCLANQIQCVSFCTWGCTALCDDEF